jgi:CRISPR-associated protein Csb2
MFAIGIRYLCGQAVATHPANRTIPEWPPHPDRVFMALAAAFFETGASPTERTALQWLETQSAPALSVSEANPRDAVTSFVPVNDDASPMGKKKAHPAVGLYPLGRNRQPRTFPTTIPEQDVLYMIWQNAEITQEHLASLSALCSKVNYLGHSSSMVQMWVETKPPAPNLTPTSGQALVRLRITGPGRLTALSNSFNMGQHPSPLLWCGYSSPNSLDQSTPIKSTVFDDSLLILRRVDGQELPLESTLALTDALRGAVIKKCPEPIPEWVSGHQANGARSEKPHLAYIPLPHVSHAHADGHLLGVAIVIPRATPAEEITRCFAPFFRFDSAGEAISIQVNMGAIGSWTVEMEQRDIPPVALRAETWTNPCLRWATVTPIVLDRYPKADGDAEETIAAACEWIGLPKPIDVVCMPVSLFIGSPHASSFIALTGRTNNERRWHTHALLTFAEPARGPVILGAGRYRGYGLCRPYTSHQENDV